MNVSTSNAGDGFRYGPRVRCKWCDRFAPATDIIVVALDDETCLPADNIQVCSRCAPGDDPEDADERGCVVP